MLFYPKKTREHRLNWRSFLRLFVIATLTCSGTSSARGDDPVLEKRIVPALQKHCIKCHGKNANGSGKVIEGDVDLTLFRPENFLRNVELVSDLIHVLDLEEMPPEDEPELDPVLRQQLIKELKSIRQSSLSKEKRYSPTPIRRMNRFQYNNAVTDLFDLKCIVFTLPERMMREHNGYFNPASGKMADVVMVGSRPLGKSQMIERRLAGVAAFPQDLRAEHGYDNRADHLSLSPLLMESFLKLGQSITQSPDFGPRNVGVWKSFFAKPKNVNDYEKAVRVRLKPFLTKAFRKIVEQKTLDRYVAFVTRQIDSGISFEGAMKSVAAATIASPRFLYLYDKSEAESGFEPTDDFELASRLSFFLWGSLPDKELLETATKGKLSDTKQLVSQFQRMLKDKKLKRFCDSFPSQWLQLERIISSVPNQQQFPKFYFLKYRDSMHMMLEPLLLFETVLIENKSITQFIDSDFTYRSLLLENAYQDLQSEQYKGKNVNGGAVGVLRFIRVPISDRRTGGVITNAAVMTMTSGPERTQPITRGAWIAGVIFNDPPEPPPADVPALGEKPPTGEENLTLRERLAMHRKRSDCRGCHEQIDPLGFALENYNAVGVWRNKYENDREVDMSGTLFRKHRFTNVVEFKDAILLEKKRFTRGFAGHLLSFALGRELGAADQIAVEQITEQAEENDYKIQAILQAVVLSEPFRTKSIQQKTINAQTR